MLRTTLTSRSSACGRLNSPSMARFASGRHPGRPDLVICPTARRFQRGLNPIASAFLFIIRKVSLQGNTRRLWRLPGLHCWLWCKPDKAELPSGRFAKVVRRGGRRYAPARPSRDALHHGPGFRHALRAAYRQSPLAHSPARRHPAPDAHLSTPVPA